MASNVSSEIIKNSNNSALTKAQNKDATATSSTSTNSVSSDAFLQLMCMQLQYQDPMNPMDNSEMLAQEAQFVTLEQMEKLASSFGQFATVYQANSLVGQNVEITNSDGDKITGTVDYVDYSDTNGGSISVKGTLYPISSVTKVFPKDASSSGGESGGESGDESGSATEKSFIEEALSYVAYNIGNISEKLNSYLGGGSGESNSGSNTQDTNK